MIREPKGVGSEVKDTTGDTWILGPDGWSWSGAATANSIYRNWTWDKLLRQEGVVEILKEVEKTFTKEQILEAYKDNWAAVDLIDALGIELPTKKKVRYVLDFEIEPGEAVEDYLDKEAFFDLDLWFGSENTTVLSVEVVND